MKTKTGLLCVAAILTLPAHAGHAITDEASLASAYNLTFYVEPNLITAATYCLTFTTNGNFPNYPRSGTYTNNSASLTGSWYENGDEIMMSGYSVGEGDTFSFSGRLLGPSNSKFGGRFIDFFPTNTDAPISAGGTFVAIKVAAGCPAGDAQPHVGPIASAAGAN
jgi:hypothetical protein